MELIAENVSVLATKLGATPEVITKFLTDAQASADVKPFVDTLGTLEVFKPEELTARISNERAAAALESKNTAVGSTYGAMDRRILEDTGIAKNAGESTLDYVTRAAKEKYGTKVEESDEIKRLKLDLAAKDGLLTQTNTKLQEMEVAHATERKQTQINGTLDSPINALSINTTPELLDSQREFVKYRFGQAYSADVVDGKVQFTDKATGEIVRDPKTAAPITAAALIEQFAPKVVSLKKTSTGQPSGFTSGRNDSTSASFDFQQYATKQAFADALAKQGITAGSPEGGKLFADFMKARPDAT